MTRRVLITRPQEDAEPVAAALRDHGIGSLIEPMMAVAPVAGPPLDLTGVQALLATSANGVRALAARSDGRETPLYAVGDATARKAAALGFRHVESASGDVEALAALVIERLDPAHGTVLHIAGSAVAGDLAGTLTAAGFTTARSVLYEARAVSALSAPAIASLRTESLDGVALFSPRTARIFSELVAAADVAGTLAPCVGYCLSTAVAEAAARLPWRCVVVASAPTAAALVDAIVRRREDESSGDFVSPDPHIPC